MLGLFVGALVAPVIYNINQFVSSSYTAAIISCIAMACMIAIEIITNNQRKSKLENLKRDNSSFMGTEL